ncbi:transaldolase [Cytophaga sp. FL35]|uniref:transaldolase n=1 Tax=Cytophaga sp. FL35 TaxID=1904456 RepID=UPI001653B580|nr:transaldolase [Cytophaga sp. FL35]MBC6998748.1 transaldolase [Cytophaga sp. FL35]
MNKHLLYLFLILFASCGSTEKTSNKVYFAGEIVNPTSEHIVLFKGDAVIDSARLDKNNRFSFNFDTLPQGLYHFNHDPEVQYVYLEGGDSLVIRLNTVDFDESLIFSGKGEEVNNFLLELFLAGEEETDQVRDYYLLEPEEFKDKIDSLMDEKLALLSELSTESDLSEKELKIAEASIFYTYSTYKESYPFRHKRRTKEKKVEDLPSTFYDYRNEITFNDKDLVYLRPYYNFVKNHIGNISYMSCLMDCDTEGKVVRNHLHFNKHKLRIIDSLVVEKELKDNLFRNVAFDYLLKVHDSEKNNEEFIQGFHELSSNNRHIEEINTLYEGIRNIQPNKKIPGIQVLDYNGQAVSLPDIAKENKTVFYFWSGVDRSHFDNIKERIAKLTKEKPHYKYVGINFKTEEGHWKALLESSKLNPETQFRATNFEELTKALILYPLNKCIITNDDVIVDAFANVYGPM